MTRSSNKRKLERFSTVFEQKVWTLDQINNLGKEIYNLQSSRDLQKFFERVAINQKETLADSICNFIQQKENQNSNNLINEEMFGANQDLGNYPFVKQIFGNIDNNSFKITICKFFWNNKESILIKLQNINYQQQIKQLEEVNQYKDSLLASVTHDLRTPLIGINYAFDQIAEIANSSEIQEFIKEGQSNVGLQESFINDILDYFQIKNNKLKLNLQEFNLYDAIQEVIKLMSINANLKQIRLLSPNKLSKDLIMYSDKRRIKQILINLVGNSIKFTSPKGKIIIEVEECMQYLKFKVIDSGAGIKSEIIPQLSEPFQTFDNENQVNAQGIGLGLNICKSLIGLLGPEKNFHISSRVSQGSKFSFLLYTYYNDDHNKEECMEEQMIKFPEQIIFSDWNFHVDLRSEPKLSSNNINNENMSTLQNIQMDKYSNFRKVSKLSLEENKLNQASSQLDVSPVSGINILIADDNMLNYIILQKYLQKLNQITQLNYIANYASNGQEALEKFCRFNKEASDINFRIIIMDCEMPVMNGYEAAFEIKKRIKKEGFVDVVIVGYTANSGQEEVQKVYSCGMNKYLMKPATENDFHQMILNVQEI